MEEGDRTPQVTTRNILQNILASINHLWHVNDETVSVLCRTLTNDGRTLEIYIVVLLFSKTIRSDHFYGFCVAQIVPFTFIEPNIQLQKAVNDLQMEVQGFQVAIGDLHLKHRPLANKVQYYRDMDAKNKAEYKHLAGIGGSGFSYFFQPLCVPVRGFLKLNTDHSCYEVDSSLVTL